MLNSDHTTATSDLSTLGDRARLVEELVNRYRPLPASTVTLLGEISRLLGYLPASVIAYVATRIGTDAATLTQLARAHDLGDGSARAANEEHRLGVCASASCAARGGNEVERVLAEKGLSFDPLWCQGACDLGPIACYNRGGPLPISAARARSLAKADPEDWEDVLSVEKPVHAFKTDVMVAFANIFAKGSHQLATAKRHGVYAPLEKAMEGKPEAVLDAVRAAGLCGTDGEAAAGRWAALRDADAERRYLVVNALEGDPGTFKDRIILERDPHLLVAGAVLAAWATNATDIFLVVRREYELAFERCKAAVEEATRAGYLGDSVCGKDFGVRMHVRLAGPSPVSDREALLAGLEGVLTRSKPGEGLFGAPTLVEEVETLSLAPAVVEKGADWFRALGQGGGCGVKLFCLSGDVKRPGNYELPRGTPLRQLVDVLGGGPLQGKTVQALLLGGAHGVLLKPDHLDDGLDEAALGGKGALGTGAVLVASEKNCLVDLVRREVAFAIPRTERASLASGGPEAVEGLRPFESGPMGRVVKALFTSFPEAVAAHAEGVCACNPRKVRK